MKKILFFLTAAYFFAGCEMVNKPETPDHYEPAVLTPTMTIKDFKALCTGNTFTVDNDVIIGGKVISSDEAGNVYRSFFLQDETSGIEVMEGSRSGMFKKYQIGQIVYIKAKGLTLGRGSGTNGVPRLGYHTTGYNNTWLDAPLLIKTNILPGYYSTPVTPKVITTGTEITEDVMGTLVTLKGVTYVSGNTYTTAHPHNTWSIGNDPYTAEDDSAWGEQTFRFPDNSTFVVRSSGYARFAETELPFAAGAKVDITGIMGRYSSTRQVTLNTDRDVIVDN